VVAVPADDIAMEVGEKKAANLVMLGAYIAKTGVISKEDVADGLRELFGAKIQFLEVNMKALEKGIQHTQK